MKYFSRLAHIFNVLLINVVVFLIAFLVLEYSARAYSYFMKGRSFFREDTFISPWITTYDYPPPRIDDDEKLLFRHRTISTSWIKPDDTIRIIAVGGSTTVCEKAYQKTGIDYPIALEKKLKRDFDALEFEVLNAGGDAYSTAHSLVNIEFRLVEMNPDVIVLMHNINDSTVNSFLEGATPDYANKYLQSYFLNPNLQGTLSVTGFLTQSRFLSKFGLPQMLANKLGDIRVENDYQEGLRLFSRNLKTISAVTELNGIELVLLSQPSSMEPHRFVSLEAFLAYNEAVEDVASQNNVTFVDMFSMMGHEKRYFSDQVHYTPEGVDLFAELLASELGPIVGRLRSGDEVSKRSSRPGGEDFGKVASRDER